LRPTDDFGAEACYKHTTMDEISRELPPDTTTTNGPRELPKGPEELVAFERGRTAADVLVVRDRFSLGGSLHGDSAAGSGGGQAAMSVVPGSDEVPPPEGSPSAEPARPASVEPESSSAPRQPDPIEPGSLADGGPVELGLAPSDAAVVADEIGAAEAAAAVAAEAEVAAIEEELELPDEEGLPPAPELTDPAEVARVVYVLMLTSREGLSLLRLAQACNTTQKLVAEALELLQQQMRSLGLPVELSKSGDTVKWMSGAEAFVYLQRLRGVKKLEKLSPAALETLAVIAYRQPVMRSEIEAIRGVKAGPMLRTLLQHKLVRCTGRADVPGRPLQYGTTQQFLERFGLGSLQELPSVKEWKNLG